MNSKALKMAYEAHINQKRKGTDIPYIVHPIEVAVILISYGASEELVSAGLLHDTLEDTKITYEDILTNFGEKVARLVLSASEPYKVEKGDKLSKKEEIESWKRRKEHTIESVKKEDKETKLLICGDKLSNIRSMVRDFDEIGDKFFNKFNAPKESQLWYYKSIVESLRELEGINMYEELKEKVKYLTENA